MIFYTTPTFPPLNAEPRLLAPLANALKGEYVDSPFLGYLRTQYAWPFVDMNAPNHLDGLGGSGDIGGQHVLSYLPPEAIAAVNVAAKNAFILAVLGAQA